jgi:ubiquinone/menaquinone biosynthesis C-methylase UbiE
MRVPASFERLAVALLATVLVLSAAAATPAAAQEESINPGINESFADPDVEKFIARFERDGRAVYDNRTAIVTALDLAPDMEVADIGAGTGFIALLLAERVGPAGKVYAVEIAQSFLDHIDARAEEKALGNVETVLGAPRSPKLAPNSLDRVFLCDTYHHFEYPYDMLAEIRKSLRPDGRLVVVDFERIKGETREFVWNMVRAGKGTFTDEIIDAGFELLEEVPFTDEHYILRFKKRDLPDEE